MTQTPLRKILVAVALAAALTSCSASAGEQVDTKGSDGKTTTTEAGGKTTTTKGEEEDPTTTTEPEETTTTTKGGGEGDIEVTDIGFTAYKDYDDSQTATAGAALENGSGDTIANFEVIFTFRDDGDKVVGTESTYVNAVEAGGTGYAEVGNVSLQGKATKVSAEAVVDPDTADYFDGAVLPVTVSKVTTDEYSGPVVSGTAKNPTKDVVETAVVVCVLLTDGGRIIGGDSTYLDTLTASSEAAWETYGVSTEIKATKAKCTASYYS